MTTTTETTTSDKTEVSAKATRRRFTKDFKLRILEQADRCTSPGESGKLLRGEGLYSSHLTAWRRQRREGTLKALGRKRGPKRTAEQSEIDKLRREVERLRKKLGHAEKIISVQKTLSEVLGIQLEDGDDASEND